MKKSNLLSVLFFVFAATSTATILAQDQIKLQQFSPAELQSLSTQDGCGCYIHDANNHISGKTFIFGDDSVTANDVSVIYAKVNGKLTKFTRQRSEYRLSLGADGGGDFEFLFPKKPSDQDILTALRNYSNWNQQGVVKEKDENYISLWRIGQGLYVYQTEEIENYSLYTSDNYSMKLFKYKKGSGVERSEIIGNIKISKKDEEWINENVLFKMYCGC